MRELKFSNIYRDASDIAWFVRKSLAFLHQVVFRSVDIKSDDYL